MGNSRINFSTFAIVPFIFLGCGSSEDTIKNDHLEPVQIADSTSNNASMDSVGWQYELRGQEVLEQGNEVRVSFNFGEQQRMNWDWKISHVNTLLIIQMDTTIIYSEIINLEEGFTDKGPWGNSPFKKYHLDPSSFSNTETAYVKMDKTYISLELTAPNGNHSSTIFDYNLNAGSQ